MLTSIKQLLSLLLIASLPAFSFANLKSFQEETELSAQPFLFKIKGSNTIGAQLAPNLVAKYLAAKGGTDIRIAPTAVANEQIVSARVDDFRVQVHVAAHGSGTGFSALSGGDADIAASSRPIKSKEKKLFKNLDMNESKREHVIAIDGLAIIVNPNNPINELSIDQVGQLFAGEISNWQELGGANQSVQLFARDNKSGTFDTFKSQVLKRGYKLSANAERFESNANLANSVLNTAGGIGFTPLATIGEGKALRIRDSESTPLNPEHLTVATEDYPLARRLFMYTNNSENVFVNEFITFVQSTQGQLTVSETGFVSQNIEALNISLDGEYPIGYQFLADHSERLSFNFRFKPDSYDLDNKAHIDLDRLVSFMKLPQNKNRKIMLYGFSGKESHELQGSVSSELRVLKVKRALKELGINASAATGYGDINPVATNDNDDFKQRNHRVEVWLK